jgi:hypothetical protein
MSDLFKATVSDSQFSQHGVGYFVQHGQPQTVGGDPMVRLKNGVLVPAEGWRSNYGDALFVAADRIEQLGRLLLTQADTIRTQARANERTSA